GGARCDVLAHAAKAALEAGEDQKARDYATQALKIANQVAEKEKRRGSKNPRRFHCVPTSDYYANFVLGRLAILNGDIRSAEQYLITSGATSGDAVLRSYGPNLSLALEILKHGDRQSWGRVLQFIAEIEVFWKTSPKHFQEWSADISGGKIPNFQIAGANL